MSLDVIEKLKFNRKSNFVISTEVQEQVESDCYAMLQELPNIVPLADLEKLKPIHRDNAINTVLNQDVKK